MWDSPRRIFGSSPRGTRASPFGRHGICDLEIQVDNQARKLYLKVFLRFWGRDERYLRMETGVLHRISLRTS